MNTRFRRTLATILASAVATSQISGLVLADEQESETIENVQFTETEQNEFMSNDDMFESYVERVFAQDTEGFPALYGYIAGNSFTFAERKMYDYLLANFERIADGEQESIELVLPLSEIFGNVTLTVDDMPAIVGTLKKAFTALLCNAPYDAYWLDKTNYSTGYSMYSSGRITSFVVYFNAAEAYAGTGEHTVDISKTSIAKRSATNAKQIVNDASDMTDLQKLDYYREQICELTDYNHDAADNDVPYGDPWQLVYVFDNDPSTKVVCEGYSKAFQFLCDMTVFDNEIACYTVDGMMKGGTGAGGHMWNIVRLHNGSNYLVDITNVDKGTIGNNGLTLFLKEATSGSYENGYIFRTMSGTNISYVYNPKMFDIYTTDDLILVTVDSGVPFPTDGVKPTPTNTPTPKPTATNTPTPTSTPTPKPTATNTPTPTSTPTPKPTATNTPTPTSTPTPKPTATNTPTPTSTPTPKPTATSVPTLTPRPTTSVPTPVIADNSYPNESFYSYIMSRYGYDFDGITDLVIDDVNVTGLAGIDQLHNLRSLTIRSFGGTIIDVSNCYNLRTLDLSYLLEHDFGAQIECIRAEECVCLERIISNENGYYNPEHQFHTLKSIELRGCYDLREFHLDDFFCIAGPDFELLDLTNCASLENISFRNANNRNPKRLYAHGCSSLISLELTINQGQEYEIVDLTNCDRLEQLLIRDVSIENLVLDGCSSLVNLETQMGLFRVKNLSMINCNSLEKLELMDNTLERVDLINCYSLERVVVRNGNGLKLFVLNCPWLYEVYPYRESMYYSSGLFCDNVELISDSPEYVPAVSPDFREYHIRVDEYTFPDPAFRKYVIEQSGYYGVRNFDFFLTPELDLSGLGIRDISGIQCFPNLEYLNCSNNMFTDFVLPDYKFISTIVCTDNIYPMNVVVCPSYDQVIDFDNPIYLGNGIKQYYGNGLSIIVDETAEIVSEQVVPVPTGIPTPDEPTPIPTPDEPTLIPTLDPSADPTPEPVSPRPTFVPTDSPILGENDVVINDINFPDSAFRENISLYFDWNKDGILSFDEISGADTINAQSSNISSAKGLEFFTDLKVLLINDNNLTNLDISNNTKLESLFCQNNNLTYLNISNNPNLIKAYEESYDFKDMYLYNKGDEYYSLFIESDVKIITSDSDVPTVPPTATPTPEPTATATPKPTATATPKPTATATPKPTATATPKPTATATPKPTATATPKPTATATPKPTATATPKPTATSTPTPVPTATATPTPTSTPVPTATPTVTPVPTATATPVPTSTPVPTATPVPTEIPTVEPTIEPTTDPEEPEVTPTEEPTEVPTVEPTVGPTTGPEEPEVTPTEEPTVEPTEAPAQTPTVEPTVKPTTVPENADVSSFAERLYTTCLGRESEDDGKDYWSSVLKSGKTGAEVAEGFFFSPEFEEKELTDEEYIGSLYETFMGRTPANEEVAYWASEMKNGQDRKSVFDGFVNSPEWADICLDYGIRSGGTAAPTHEKVASTEVKGFAERLYTSCLGRESEEAGLEYWSKELANLKQTGTEAARGFFFSPEFINKNLSNEEFVTRLYETFMGREPDKAGFDYWVGELNKGVSRENVFNNFSAAPEFADLCAASGILR